MHARIAGFEQKSGPSSQCEKLIKNSSVVPGVILKVTQPLVVRSCGLRLGKLGGRANPFWGPWGSVGYPFPSWHGCMRHAFLPHSARFFCIRVTGILHFASQNDCS